MVFACGSVLFRSVAVQGLTQVPLRSTLALLPPSPAVRFAPAVSFYLTSHTASALTPCPLSCLFIRRISFTLSAGGFVLLHRSPSLAHSIQFVYFKSAGGHSHWGAPLGCASPTKLILFAFVPLRLALWRQGWVVLFVFRYATHFLALPPAHAPRWRSLFLVSASFCRQGIFSRPPPLWWALFFALFLIKTSGLFSRFLGNFIDFDQSNAVFDCFFPVTSSLFCRLFTHFFMRQNVHFVVPYNPRCFQKKILVLYFKTSYLSAV